jgi:hypothetical protein
LHIDERPGAARAILGVLERVVRPELVGLGRRWSSFKLLGCVGAALAVTVGTLLAYCRGLSLSVVLVMSAFAVVFAVGFYLVSWRVAGTRRLVYYRYEVTILSGLAGLLWLVDQPIIVYLDVAILGLGTFLVAGRFGCFMVGCCHGIPHDLGVPYGASHVRAGFPEQLAHTRLLPVQVIESAWVLVMVVAGGVVLARGSDPGRVFSAWIMLYGFGRYHLELVRGDPARRYFAGFSEAQWTSLVLMLASIVAGAWGVVPLRAWHIVLGSIVGVEMLATVGGRAVRGTGAHLLSRPQHVDQLAVLLFELRAARAAPPGSVLVGTTSLGIRLSMVRSAREDERAPQFTLSRDGSALPECDARTLARWLARLGGISGAPSLQIRDSGVVHVVFPRSSTAGRSTTEASAVADAVSSAPAASGSTARFQFREISILPEPERQGDVAATVGAAGDRRQSTRR